MKFFLHTVIIFFFAICIASGVEKKQGVYEEVLHNIGQDFQQVVQRLDSAFTNQGFKVLATIPNGVPAGCSYRATVLAVYQPDYGKQLLAMNSTTAPYALVDRIIVFEDENGLHVAIVNPINILRTVLMDDHAPLTLADSHRQLLRDIIIKGMNSGQPSTHQYGQFRKKGYIGRTMGVMAGSPFDEKINIILTASVPLSDALNKVKTAFQNNTGDWGVGIKYVLQLSEAGIVVLGVSSSKVEARSYQIVGAGSDRSRKNFKCPGIAHAGAYPMEVVIRQKNGKIAVEVVDIMYRMKMYFEDAGKWAFAKNMTMPGSIQNEIEDIVRKAFQ